MKARVLKKGSNNSEIIITKPSQPVLQNKPIKDVSPKKRTKKSSSIKDLDNTANVSNDNGSVKIENSNLKKEVLDLKKEVCDLKKMIDDRDKLIRDKDDDIDEIRNNLIEANTRLRDTNNFIGILRNK